MKRIAIPPMLGDLIRSTILAMDGTRFTDLPACPSCSGPLRRHDLKEKRFAHMRIGEERKDIHVTVARFRCRACGGFWYAREPFYEGVRFGIPVVDLAITLSRVHPYHHTERILASLGLVVDRGTIRMYSRMAQREVPATDLLGIPLPISLLNLSNLFSRRPKGAPVPGAEVLGALGLPPAHRAAAKGAPATAAEDRDEGDEEDEEEPGDPRKEEYQGRGN
ncbi:MAG TPA: hypothetical protein VLU98_01365 [Methanomicrobiales archaeon]|nr:hypothetical protein [Methanomicrobiales archaeon]